MNRLFLLALALAAALVLPVTADDSPGAAQKIASAPDHKTDPKYPFRTDSANTELPWYQPQPGEFPPHHSDHRVSGELVSADFIHRSGQFRASHTGELMDFVMPPYGSVIYQDAEADLRDVPLGTFFLFFLNQDPAGGFTRLATMKDQYSIDAGHGFTYHLDELQLGEGKLLTTKHSIPKNQPDLGKRELLVTDQTRVWKGDKQAQLSDLAAGDELLFNITGKRGSFPGRCTDIWVGVETHDLVTAQQRAKNAAFVKFRGLPGWIDRVEGNELTVTLFSGDPKHFEKTWMADFNASKDLSVAVANEELRTWNPPTDKERSKLVEIAKAPVNCYGSSGFRLVFTVANMLEGFRKGRVVRIFGNGWTLKDQWYGESLMAYGYGRLQTPEIMELLPKEYPAQFPFRTEYGNAHLPWYQLQPDAFPPRFSEHVVIGKLFSVDAEKRSGQFLANRSGGLVDFTLIPAAVVKHLGADADLSDLPLGTRVRLHLYQDEQGDFTRASLISDECSYLVSNAVTLRIDALQLDDGKLHVSRRIPEVKNYNGDMEQPSDIGRIELLVNAETRVWKGDDQIQLTDLALGDALLVNVSGEVSGDPSRCTDIWVGPETHKLVTERQAKKHAAAKKQPARTTK